MYDKYLIPFLIFIMKYFFDVQREITLQLLNTAEVRFHDCKELLSQLNHLTILNK